MTAHSFTFRLKKQTPVEQNKDELSLGDFKDNLFQDHLIFSC